MAGFFVVVISDIVTIISIDVEKGFVYIDCLMQSKTVIIGILLNGYHDIGGV